MNNVFRVKRRAVGFFTLLLLADGIKARRLSPSLPQAVTGTPMKQGRSKNRLTPSRPF